MKTFLTTLAAAAAMSTVGAASHGTEVLNEGVSNGKD